MYKETEHLGARIEVGLKQRLRQKARCYNVTLSEATERAVEQYVMRDSLEILRVKPQTAQLINAITDDVDTLITKMINELLRNGPEDLLRECIGHCAQKLNVTQKSEGE